jgi:hypothetical protein
MGGEDGDTATLISFVFVSFEHAISPKLKIVAKNTKNRRFILGLLELRWIGFIDEIADKRLPHQFTLVNRPPKWF